MEISNMDKKLHKNEGGKSCPKKFGGQGRPRVNVVLQLTGLIVIGTPCLWIWGENRLLWNREAEVHEELLKSQAKQAQASTKASHGGYGNHSLALPWNAIKTHPGVADSHFAHLYGDERMLENYVNKLPTTDTTGDSGLVFNRQTVFRECDQAVLNGYRDVWCRDKKAFSISHRSGNGCYEYFKAARWMEDGGSNFVVHRCGKIELRTAGLYLVNANVRIRLSGAGSMYGLMAVINEEVNGSASAAAGTCVKQTDKHSDSQHYHCSVSEVMYLRAGDKVSLDVQPFVYFDVSHDCLHLTVIKLDEGYQPV